MSEFSEIVDTILEAYRSREIAAVGGGFSLSQQNNFSCSQMLSQSHAASREWISSSCREQIERIPVEDLHFLLREVDETNLPDLLKALQHLFPCKNENGAKSWLAMIQVYMQDVSLAAGQKGRDLMNFFLNQVDHLDGHSCVNLLEGLLTSIGPDFDVNHTKCLDLLPKLLDRASQMKVVRFCENMKSSKRPSEYSGLEYLDYVLSELCRRDWPKGLVIPLITTIRDLHLTDDHLRAFVRKVSRETKRLDLQELPPLVYQVLLLSSQGHRCLFLRDIFQLFNDLDEKCEWSTGRAQGGEIVESGISEAELVHIEGTVIHYFSFAVKQDPGLGSDILKLLKGRQFQLSPFEVALLLSLYKVQRYEAKIFDILKRAVECEHTHDFHRSVSPWIESLHDLASPTSMSSVMKAVLRRSGKGWEHIMAGFVGFALNLLTCFSKKSCTSKGQQAESQTSGVVGMGNLTSGSANKGISKHVVCFSLQLLERAFRKHEAVRNEILGQIFSGVVTRDESSTHFVQLLSRIASSCCRDVMDCVAKVKDALEYISFMPPSTAVSLVRSLQPVLRSQTSLQDFLLIVLRKSLFSRELESRLVTLECLLFIAGTSNPPSARPSVGHGSSSQVSELELIPVDSVAIEIISQLRRCMSQQVQLRSALYDGLIELVITKPNLADYILGILLPQLEKYIEKDGDGVISQFLVHTCIEEVSGGIGEPLAHLLRAIMSCLVVSANIVDGAQDGPMGDSNIMQARSTMQKLATLLAASELSDFELDRQSEFEKPSVLHMAKLLHGVYEVTLEYIVIVISLSSQTWTKRFLTMVERSKTLSDLLKDHSRPAKGRKVSVSAVDDKTTLITCQFSGVLLAVVGKVMDGCVFDSATCASLFEDVQCMAMVLQTALKQLHRMRSLIDTTPADMVREQVFKDLKMLVPLLFRQYCANSASDRHFSSASKKSSAHGKSLAVLAFDALESSLVLASSKFGIEEFAQVSEALLQEMDSAAVAAGQDSLLSQGRSDSQSDPNIKISRCIQLLQKEFDTYEGQADYDQAKQILCILNPFYSILHNDYLAEHLPWIEKKCKSLQCALASIPCVTKVLVLAYLRSTVGDCKLKAAKSLAGDVRNRLGFADGEEGSEELDECLHKIVIDESIAAVTSTLSDALKGCCEEVEWVLSFLDQSLRQDVFEDGEAADLPENVAALKAYRNVDDQCINRLACIFDVLRILTTCDFETSQTSHEIVLGTIARVYKAAEIVSKRLAAAKAKPSKAFIALIQNIGTKMNESMYCAIFRYMKGQENAATRAQINKEQKLIPTLIFHVESLEANLIKISMLSKIDLMRNFKRSAARDFKIDFAAITSKMSEEVPEKRKPKKEGGKGKKRAADDASTPDSAKKAKRGRKKACRAEDPDAL